MMYGAACRRWCSYEDQAHNNYLQGGRVVRPRVTTDEA